MFRRRTTMSEFIFNWNCKFSKNIKLLIRFLSVAVDRFNTISRMRDILFGKIRINHSNIFYDLHMISSDGFMIAIKEKNLGKKVIVRER